jgi:hypothetical protein
MAIPALALLGVQVGASLFSGALEGQAGKDDARALEFQAENESINAVVRNTARQERLLDAIASANVAQGASGVSSFSGSPLTVLNESIKRSSKRGSEDMINSQIKQLQLRSSAFARRRSSQLAAFGSLLSTGVDVAKTGVFAPKGTNNNG